MIHVMVRKLVIYFVGALFSFYLLDCLSFQCLWLKRDNWKSKELSFISHAKEVVIHYKFRSNVIEFAYYILEHAHDLEKIIIYYPHCSEVLNAVMKLRTTTMSKGIHFHKIVTHYDYQVIRSLVRFNLW